MEEHEIPNGWPLGLEAMTVRLRVVETVPARSAVEVENYSSHAPSASFSSFASSELNTESTVSFFQDHSVSLGRLIGIRPVDRGHMYFPNSICLVERDEISGFHESDVSEARGIDLCRGVCGPLLVCLLMKTSRWSKSKAGR